MSDELKESSDNVNIASNKSIRRSQLHPLEILQNNEKKRMELYGESVIAFLDILGFKEFVEEAFSKEKQDNEDRDWILDVLQQIKETENLSAQPPEKNGEHSVTISPALTAFSDCIVISYPISKLTEDINICHVCKVFCNYMSKLAVILIKKGFIFRSGLILGEIYHQNGIPIGKGMNEAYLLESKKAKMPRVLVSPELVNIYKSKIGFNEIIPFFKDNEDEEYYCLNYFAFNQNLVSEYDFLKVAEEQLKNFSDEYEKAGEKIKKWEYFKTFLKKCGAE